jgi:hypothetical protein
VTDSIVQRLARYYTVAHSQVLALAERLDYGQLGWAPNRTTLSIGFHVWHLARWADYLQEAIRDGGVQIWESERVASRWGLDAVDMGFADTGMGMGDEASTSLPLPGKELLLD